MLSTFEETLPQLVKMAAAQPRALVTLTGDAVALAGMIAATGGDVARLPPLVRLSGRAGAALFALARAEGKTLELPLADNAVVPITGQPSESNLHVRRWLDAFFAALTVGDAASVTLLAVTPAGRCTLGHRRCFEIWRSRAPTGACGCY